MVIIITSTSRQHRIPSLALCWWPVISSNISWLRLSTRKETFVHGPGWCACNACSLTCLRILASTRVDYTLSKMGDCRPAAAPRGARAPAELVDSTFPDWQAAGWLSEAHSDLFTRNVGVRLSPICIAPMLDVTNQPFRWMFRRLTRTAKLYTEMVVDSTILFAEELETHLGADAFEDPVALQLGGSDPWTMAEAAYIAEARGSFCELNINVGCPSPKVCRSFGARLMREPDRVRAIVHAIGRRVTHTPVTVKTRIGVDGSTDYATLTEFVSAVKSGGVGHVIVHARSCILDGLSVAENRRIPPLKYDVVHRLITDFPDMTFCLNGGITSLAQAREHLTGTYQPSSKDVDLSWVDAWRENAGAGGDLAVPPISRVMLGRKAWHDPWAFRCVDSMFGGVADPGLTRRQVIESLADFAEAYPDYRTDNILQASYWLTAGLPKSKVFRRKISELMIKAKQGSMSVAEVIDDALGVIPGGVLDEGVNGSKPEER